MQNEFVNRLNNIKKELLNLKTNKKYTQARPINYTSVSVSESGIYRFTYSNNGENVLSFIDRSSPVYIEVLCRSIQNYMQDVEIYINPQSPVTSQLTVLSTSEVIGFQKVG